MSQPRYLLSRFMIIAASAGLLSLNPVAAIALVEDVRPMAKELEGDVLATANGFDVVAIEALNFFVDEPFWPSTYMPTFALRIGITARAKPPRFFDGM